MDESALTSRKGKSRAGWWRKAGWALAAILLLIVIFHRWIFYGVVNIAVRAAERTAKLEISYELQGSVVNSLEISKLRIRPLNAGALKKLTLDRLSLRYHPWDGMLHGWPALVESVELRNLDLVIDATLPRAPGVRRARPKKSARFRVPFPELVDLRGIHVRVQTTAGLLDVDNANLTLLPDQSGVLSVDNLIIPGYRTWTNLHATTSYLNRDLIVENLAIDKNLIARRLQIDASRIGEQQLNAALSAAVFGGNLDAHFSLANMGLTNDMTLTVGSQQVDLAQLFHFAAPNLRASGKLASLQLLISGQADDGATWNGGLNVHLEKPTIHPFAFDVGTLKAIIHNGNITFTDTALVRSSEWIALTGGFHLPGHSPNTRPFEANLGVWSNFPEIAAFMDGATGSGTLNGTLRVTPVQFHARVESQVENFAFQTWKISSAQVDTTFSKLDLSNIDWKKPWWNKSHSTTNITAGELTLGEYALDRVSANIRSNEENVRIVSLELTRKNNRAAAKGTLHLQMSVENPLPGVLDLELKIDGPNLRDFAVSPDQPAINGTAKGSGSLHWEHALPEGNFALTAGDLSLQGVKLGSLDMQLNASDGAAKLTRLLLDMPGKSFLQATGNLDLRNRESYTAQVSARLNDLSQFKPLLAGLSPEIKLGGTVELDWNGTGDLGTPNHEGRLALMTKDGIFAAVDGIRLQTSGYYTPTQGEFPNFDLATSKGNLTGSISYAQKLLHIDNLKMTQNGELRLSGNIAWPFDLENIADSAKRFPMDAPLAIELVAKDVKLGGLLVDLGILPPETGLVSLDIQAKGTLRNPDALIALKGQDLRSDRFKQIAPLSGEINIAVADQRANVTGNVREPSLQPIAISGSVPLDLPRIIETGSIDPKLPLQARLTMPSTPLAFLPRYVTPIRVLDGNLSFDVGMEGTLEKPVFLGSLKSRIENLRFRSDSLPTVRGIDMDLTFRDNRLTFNRLKGDLAGGPFSFSGGVDLKNLSEPVFDIKLQGNSILLVRNDSIVVRTNLDLEVKGPLATAAVTGNVGITDSRFFREIDILPINLPGRPVPPIQAERPDVSITVPPFRDWKFDVDIKTLDTFRITGNLASGEVVVGLNLGGTGLAPTLDGNVQISQLKAALPFSRLNIEYGNVYFSKDLPPLNPVVDLHGKSKVRDYDIDAYIWGDLLKPQTLFLSQPPLTQEDILTLLATGVTQSEIAENPQLLAGRAGWLFVQKYYNKIFRRKQSFEQDSLADRLDVQVGNVDPKTGRESASVRLRLSDRWQIIGDLDVTGGVRGQVRYLLRFK